MSLTWDIDDNSNWRGDYKGLDDYLAALSRTNRAKFLGNLFLADQDYREKRMKKCAAN